MRFKHGAPPLGNQRRFINSPNVSIKVTSSVQLLFVPWDYDDEEDDEDYGSVLPDPKPQRPKGR